MKLKIIAIAVSILGLVFVLNHFPTKKQSQNNIAMAMANLPISFIENQGQLDKSVRFYTKGKDHSIFFNEEEIVYGFSDSVIKQKFVGSNPSVKMKGFKKAQGKVNYFVGKDKKNWKQNISTYEEIVYENLYPGIDLVFAGTQGKMKSEFRVAAGVDYKKILVAYEGLDELKISDSGDLIIQNQSQELKELRPYIYQEIDGRKVEVAGKYIIDKNQFRFEITKYDPIRELIIDPEIMYSTYLGGYGGGESIPAIEVDATGNMYVTSCIVVARAPAASPEPTVIGDDGASVFIAKLNPEGSAMIYATFFGGNFDECPADIALDAEGNVFITGFTQSANFPVSSPWQSSLSGDPAARHADAFLAKLNASGSALIYSTYFGGSRPDRAKAIAIDTVGNAYITGWTTSTDFPVTKTITSTLSVYEDIFVAKFDANGSRIYSASFGGSRFDSATSLAIDAEGDTYIAGQTKSSNFPTVSPFQPSIRDDLSPENPCRGDVFISKLNSTGEFLVFSTYLGGARSDKAHAITIDSTGNIYVAGETGSDNFPIVSPLQAVNMGPVDSLCGGGDAFVAKLNPSGSALIYSTYLGGEGGADEVNGIAIDAIDNVYLTGGSADFPMTSPLQDEPPPPRGWDVLVTKLSASGSILYSSLFGGSRGDVGEAVTVDRMGNIYITGRTPSDDFPTVSPLQEDFAYELPSAGVFDGFITKIGEPLADLRLYQGIALNRRVGRPFSLNFTISNNGPNAVTDIVLTNSLPLGLNYISYIPHAGLVTCAYSSATRRVTCNFSGTIESGRRRSVTINIRAVRSGIFENSGEVTSSATDPNTANNVAIQRFSVSR